MVDGSGDHDDNSATSFHSAKKNGSTGKKPSVFVCFVFQLFSINFQKDQFPITMKEK